jgi:integral membrane protein
MPLAPRAADLPRLPGALRFYKVMAYITGTFLLLLVGEMILKYSLDFSHGLPQLKATGYELELGGAYGFISLVPVGMVQAVNLSTAILIVHGWLYVTYLFAGFRLWSMMRWPIGKFLIIALGGIVPVLSFVVEHFYGKQVSTYLASTVAPSDPTPEESAA